MKNPWSSFPLAAVLTTCGLVAQGGELATSHAAAAIADLHIPIHELGAVELGDPTGRAREVLAMGNGYKVAFHDGFTFYPFLGSDYPENLPLRWDTTRVTIGGVAIVSPDERPTHASAEWHYEYQFGSVVERYDVLEKGVEQTFVLAHRPAQSGDLVIEGRIDTPLHCEPVLEPRHTALTFADDAGRPILRYSEAYAFDATGNRTIVTTRFDGENVALTLDGDWLANATYPVVVDPLTAPVGIDVGPADIIQCDIARDDVRNELLVVATLALSSGDQDQLGWLYSGDFLSRRLVQAHTSPSVSIGRTEVASCEGAARFMVAYDFLSPGGYGVQLDQVQVGARTVDPLVLGNFPGRVSGDIDSNVSVGGGRGNTALICIQRDPLGQTGASQLWALPYDMTRGFSVQPAPFRLPRAPGTSTNVDQEMPRVSRTAYSSERVVVWREYDNAVAGDDWDIVGALVKDDGTVVGVATFAADTIPTRHSAWAFVDGGGQFDNYMLTYNEFDNPGNRPSQFWSPQVYVQPFTWSSTQPLQKQPRVLLSTANDDQSVEGISFDENTESHWLITTVTRNIPRNGSVHRVGSTGRVLASHQLDPRPGRDCRTPRATFDNDSHEFAIVWTDPAQLSFDLYGARLTYPPATSSVVSSTGCVGEIQSWNGSFGSVPPFIGSAFHAVDYSMGVANAQSILLAAPSSGTPGFPLSTGCEMNLNVFALVSAATAISNANGDVRYALPIPDEPLLTVDIFWQVVQLDLSGGAIELKSSPVLHEEIR